MSDGIKSGIALELEMIQKEINEIYAKIVANNKLLGIGPVGFITWDDEITKKIDIDELLKQKEQEPPKKNYCYPHFWVKYLGLNEEYWFCKYCDEKSKKP